MGAYAPAGFRNKKAPKFFQTLVQTFLCTAYAPAGKPPKRDGTEYPDLVCGLSSVLSAKPSPLPRVTALLRRRKEHTPYSAVSASGIFTPFLCAGFHRPCSVCQIFTYIFIYILFMIVCQYKILNSLNFAPNFILLVSVF